VVLDAQSLEDSPVRILILSDSRKGHLNQSVAFAEYLEAHYDILPVAFTCRTLKLLSYVLDFFKIYTLWLFKNLEPLHQTYDLIVSAGSGTYYANKTLARALNIKSVTMMLPQGYRYDFDLIFAQEHDHPPRRTNIVVLPANFSRPRPQGLFTPKAPSVGIVIGGDNALLKMDKERLKNQLDAIFQRFQGYEIALTTSPRTSKEIEALVERYPFAYRVIFSQTPINPIADFLEHCEVVFITIDSTSMISEAIGYGTSCVEVLPLNAVKNTKFFAMAKTLEQEGYLHLFDGTVARCNRKIDFKRYAQEIGR
jgi:mitochondrial fission protein ELM1